MCEGDWCATSITYGTANAAKPISDPISTPDFAFLHPSFFFQPSKKYQLSFFIAVNVAEDLFIVQLKQKWPPTTQNAPTS